MGIHDVMTEHLSCSVAADPDEVQLAVHRAIEEHAGRVTVHSERAGELSVVMRPEPSHTTGVESPVVFITIAPREHGSWLRTEIVDCHLTQQTVLHLPIGPRHMDGTDTHRCFLRSLGDELTRLDPSAQVELRHGRSPAIAAA
jgi:hypothetical protein